MLSETKLTPDTEEVQLETYFPYIAIGLFAGTFAGLLGVGGGIIVVPLLSFLFQAKGYDSDSIMRIASGTSLATISITSLSSSYAHNKRKAVFWSILKRLLPGLAIGAFVGAFLAHEIPGRSLEIIFGLFEILVAARLLSGKRGEMNSPISDYPWTQLWGGGIIGVISSMLGVGGGTLVVPFLLWFGVSIRIAIGTAAACGFPLAVFGSIGFILSGLKVSGLPESCFGYVHLPAFVFISLAAFFSAQFGARLAHSIPVDRLKNYFGLLLLLLGVAMLYP